MSEPVLHKDSLFSEPQDVKPFEFNQDVAKVFDDMITRSVPAYATVQHQILSLIRQFKGLNARILDLGCSTGALLYFLDEQLQNPSMHYTGVDLSPSMIAKAKDQQVQLQRFGTFKFIQADLMNLDYSESDVIVLNYTLQFLNLQDRLTLLQKINQSIKPGTLVIVSEKTLQRGIQLGDGFISIHEAFKASNNYSRLEIAQKRKAIENVLIPISLQENLQMLQKSGFTDVDCFFCWFNFASFVAIKS